VLCASLGERSALRTCSWLRRTLSSTPALSPVSPLPSAAARRGRKPRAKSSTRSPATTPLLLPLDEEEEEEAASSRGAKNESVAETR